MVHFGCHPLAARAVVEHGHAAGAVTAQRPLAQLAPARGRAVRPALLARVLGAATPAGDGGIAAATLKTGSANGHPSSARSIWTLVTQPRRVCTGLTTLYRRAASRSARTSLSGRSTVNRSPVFKMTTHSLMPTVAGCAASSALS